MYRIEITEPAERDLSKAADYIAHELRNPQAAVDLLDLAEKTLNGLTELPNRHALVGLEGLAEQGIRWIPVGNYLAFYAVRETEEKVSILRFLYGRRDWMNLIKPKE